MIPKPGKQPEEVKSYIPISLLPTLSKIFEKLLFECLIHIIDKRNLIPNHQFGSRIQHESIE